MAEYLTVKEVSEILGIRVTLVRDYINNGVIVADRAEDSRIYRINVDQIPKMIMERESEQRIKSTQLCWSCINYNKCNWAVKGVHVDKENEKSGNRVDKCSQYKCGKCDITVNCEEDLITAMYKCAVKDYMNNIKMLNKKLSKVTRAHIEKDTQEIREFLPSFLLKRVDQMMAI